MKKEKYTLFLMLLFLSDAQAKFTFIDFAAKSNNKIIKTTRVNNSVFSAQSVLSGGESSATFNSSNNLSGDHISNQSDGKVHYSDGPMSFIVKVPAKENVMPSENDSQTLRNIAEMTKKYHNVKVFVHGYAAYPSYDPDLRAAYANMRSAIIVDLLGKFGADLSKVEIVRAKPGEKSGKFATIDVVSSANQTDRQQVTKNNNAEYIGTSNVKNTINIAWNGDVETLLRGISSNLGVEFSVQGMCNQTSINVSIPSSPIKLVFDLIRYQIDGSNIVYSNKKISLVCPEIREINSTSSYPLGKKFHVKWNGTVNGLIKNIADSLGIVYTELGIQYMGDPIMIDIDGQFDLAGLLEQVGSKIDSVADLVYKEGKNEIVLIYKRKS